MAESRAAEAVDTPSPELSQAPVQAGDVLGTQRLVVRNALILVVTQLLGMPLSILVNAAMARGLGAADFGYIYLASTFASFGFLAVDWGLAGVLPALVARERGRAGELLGSGLVWRIGAAVVVYGVLASICLAVRYSRDFQIAFALVMLSSFIGTILSACQATIRGFERTDVTALGTMAQQVLAALFVLPTLYFGGRLAAVLVAQAASAAVVLLVILRVLRPAGVSRLAFRFETMKRLLAGGTAFLFFDLAMVLQPNVDAIFLSRLAPPEPIGWLAAARKLLGVLVYPASAVCTALYPTLCRLRSEDEGAFRRTSAGALRTATTLAVPVAAGCALYPSIGVQIFSRRSFGPAESDLRILALFLLIVFFTMVLGTTLNAAGRERAWACTQFLCVIVSVVLDPLLIPWFQTRTGNGGLGVCISTVISEGCMLLGGTWLLPRGIVDGALAGRIIRPLAAGGAMAGAAWLLSSVPPLAAAPCAVAVYFGALWLIGGIDREQVAMLRSIIRSKRR